MILDVLELNWENLGQSIDNPEESGQNFEFGVVGYRSKIGEGNEDNRLPFEEISKFMENGGMIKKSVYLISYKVGEYFNA